MNTETSGRWFRKFWWLLGIAVGCLIWVYSAGVSRINRAEKAFKDGDLESAYALAMEELESNPESSTITPLFTVLELEYTPTYHVNP